MAVRRRGSTTPARASCWRRGEQLRARFLCCAPRELCGNGPSCRPAHRPELSAGGVAAAGVGGLWLLANGLVRVAPAVAEVFARVRSSVARCKPSALCEVAAVGEASVMHGPARGRIARRGLGSGTPPTPSAPLLCKGGSDPLCDQRRARRSTRAPSPLPQGAGRLDRSNAQAASATPGCRRTAGPERSAGNGTPGDRRRYPPVIARSPWRVPLFF
jgi:hypothetical protein